MENYLLYGEICHTDLLTLFKGRRKSAIAYVSIHRYDSLSLDQVTANVRILHSLDHTHILKFLEWYQSPQHVWMVTELASGGTLADVMELDGPIPLNKLQHFITDILLGLNYVHSQGYVMCDLIPSKILLDSNSTLKLYDFSLAHRHGDKQWTSEYIQEGIKQYFSKFIDESQKVYDLSELVLKAKRISLPRFPSPFYLSPESVTSCLFSFQSDLWSVGCIMYELWSGFCPFVAETPQDLIHLILHEVPRDMCKETKEMISDKDEMLTIMRGLLAKDRLSRIDWSDLEKMSTLWS